MARLHPLLQPYEPEAENLWDRYKAAHLLNRAGFGGTPQEVTRVLELGPQRAVDWLLDFPDAGADEQSQTDVPDLSSIEGFPKTFRELQKELVGKTQEERMKARQRFQAANREAVQAIMAWWMRRMASGPHPLQEKLTLFWHGHFTTSAKDERMALLIWNQNELLRRQGAGNFREFVRQISRDPAMLDYLNNQQNRKQKPNENYARELMELFTLGIGNYTEQDIKEAARAFTGWGHDGESFQFRKWDHDDGIKTFFGKRGNFDGDDVIDLILAHRACSPYVASRLFSFFAYDETDPAILDSLGQVLKDNRWELRPVLQTLLTSKAFYSERSIGTQIKSPVQLVVGTVRLLGIEMPPNQRLLTNALEQMGQVPLMPPNVKGWPGGRSWINTSTLFVRYNTAVWLAGGGASGAGMGGRRNLDRINARRIQTDFRPTASGSSEQVVDEWVQRLVHRPIDPDKRRALIDALGDEPDREESLKTMIQLIVSMPEFQLC